MQGPSIKRGYSMRLTTLLIASIAFSGAAFADALDTAKPSKTDCAAVTFVLGMMVEEQDAAMSAQLQELSFNYVNQAISAGTYADTDDAVEGVGNRAAELMTVMTGTDDGVDRAIALMGRCNS